MTSLVTAIILFYLDLSPYEFIWEHGSKEAYAEKMLSDSKFFRDELDNIKLTLDELAKEAPYDSDLKDLYDRGIEILKGVEVNA